MLVAWISIWLLLDVIEIFHVFPDLLPRKVSDSILKQIITA